MVKMCRLASYRGSVWPILSVVAALGLAPWALGCTTVEYADSVSQANPLDAVESDLIGRLNDMRTQAGVPVLKVCATLNQSASSHSDDMRDKGYLKDIGPDGSTAVSRACDAGFSAACEGSVGMAELLAKGFAGAAQTLEQWAMDEGTKPVLVNGDFLTVGVGRSMGGESAIWTLDLAAAVDPSCDAAAP
ncbi:CAP domain-containing protein [Polyangium sorediatum]|uniref:CAP domain-containing protein n=1 Tax=Polyangium sorediatum TaxID=889274 RepID=A0ABT6P7S3_9BACT|nr:CAP domain-containing protein [Polyangium sorediatum]MDI1436628.1 CAP domain-containing protein [Polyangium sorediatum]